MKPSFQPFKVSFRHNPPPIRRIPFFKLGKQFSRASWTQGRKELWSRPSSWVTWILEDLGPEDRGRAPERTSVGRENENSCGECVCVCASVCACACMYVWNTRPGGVCVCMYVCITLARLCVCLTLAQGVCVTLAQGVCVCNAQGVCVCNTRPGGVCV